MNCSNPLLIPTDNCITPTGPIKHPNLWLFLRPAHPVSPASPSNPLSVSSDPSTTSPQPLLLAFHSPCSPAPLLPCQPKHFEPVIWVPGHPHRHRSSDLLSKPEAFRQSRPTPRFRPEAAAEKQTPWLLQLLHLQRLVWRLCHVISQAALPQWVPPRS